MIERLAVAAPDVKQVRIARDNRGECGRLRGQIDKNRTVPAPEETGLARAEESADGRP